jgi:two-component system, NarL family, nitrate/nitrite response regulator NarL
MASPKRDLSEICSPLQMTGDAAQPKAVSREDPEMREPLINSSESDLRFSVLVLSEIRLLAEGLAQVLTGHATFSVCGSCRDLAEALARLPALSPDIVLVDATLPDGPACVARIRTAVPGIKVVAVAATETPKDIISWAEAGAVGYIPKTAALLDVAPLLVDIMRGEQSCSRSVAAGLLQRLSDVRQQDSHQHERPPAPPLTGREMQMLQLISNGLTNKEIARRLNIGLGTTKTHVHNLLQKLALQRRTQAALWMRQNRIHSSLIAFGFTIGVPLVDMSIYI